MSSQLTAVNGQATIITGVGTTVVKNTTATLHRIITPGTYIGSVQFDDIDTAAGTTATTTVFTLGLPTTSIPQVLEVGIIFKKGLLFQATGTPACTIVWS